jgi:hypothetical protein
MDLVLDHFSLNKCLLSMILLAKGSFSYDVTLFCLLSLVLIFIVTYFKLVGRTTGHVLWFFKDHATVFVLNNSRA